MKCICYAATVKRSKNTYITLFRALKEATENIGINLSPSYHMIDFEIAAASASKNVFKNTRITFCHFHFAQAIWRKLKKQNLVSEVREKNVEKIIADIIALPMVPKHLVHQRHFATKPNIWLWIMSIKDFDETTTIAIEQEEHQQRQTRPRHRKNIQRDQDLFNLKQKLEKQCIDIEEYCVQLRHFSYTYMKQLDE
ncbi:unnamed protein product [Rotaria sp. Silwood1]|nr:unnamed protein product [Rotaria sp. Silwood1]CAF1627326.1 unnamed protein product [Rotaria sp. Silwood1]